MKQAARTLVATAAGLAVIALGLVALAAAKLWRRWDRWKTQRLLGRLLQQRQRPPKAPYKR